MKKSILIITMTIIMTMLVGCVDADVTIDVEKDGTGKAMIEVLGPEIIANNISEETISDIGKDYEKVEKIENEGKSGYRFTTKQGYLTDIFKDVTNLNESLEKEGITNASSGDNIVNEMYEKYVDIKKEDSIFFTVYDVNLNIKDAVYSEMTKEQQAITSFIGQGANIGFHLKFPTNLNYSNATSVTNEDGKYIYNWDYTLSNVENISFSAKVPNIKNIIIIAVTIILLVFLLFRKIKKRKQI